MVDHTQICPLSVSPLGLFQGIICNIKIFERGDLELLGGAKLEQAPDLKGETSDPSSYHARYV